MSIFINNEVKNNTTSYLFGLMVPILIGWGCSIISMSILMSHDGPVSELTYVHYFFFALWILGFVVIWPLLAWKLMLRAKKLENLSYNKGAWMSIKLYIVLMVYSLISMVVSYLLWGGENVF